MNKASSSKGTVNGAVLDVLTLDEAAAYLRISNQSLKTLADAGMVPARIIGPEYRFLREALNDWLRAGDTHTENLLRLGGKYKGDKSLAEIRRQAYEARGRAETEE